MVDAGNGTLKFYPADPIPTVVASSGLDGPNAVAVDKTGNLYVANYNSNTIQKVTPDGTASVFASANLNGPAGLALDGFGNLYVANAGGNTITKFSPKGESSNLLSGLNGPTGLTFDD